MLIFCTQKAEMVLEARVASCTTPWLRQVLPLNDGNCRLAMSVVKGCCARDALPQTFNIGLFKSNKKKSTKKKRIYDEYANLVDSGNVDFDTSDW